MPKESNHDYRSKIITRLFDFQERWLYILIVKKKCITVSIYITCVCPLHDEYFFIDSKLLKYTKSYVCRQPV